MNDCADAEVRAEWAKLSPTVRALFRIAHELPMGSKDHGLFLWLARIIVRETAALSEPPAGWCG